MRKSRQEGAGRKEKKGIASLRARSNIDDSEMNSKQERQGNQPVSAAVENANETRQEQCRIARHRLVPSVSSFEASRHPSRNEPRIAYPLIAFHCPVGFPKHAIPAVVYPLLILVSFFVSFYLVS